MIAIQLIMGANPIADHPYLKFACRHGSATHGELTFERSVIGVALGGPDILSAAKNLREIVSLNYRSFNANTVQIWSVGNDVTLSRDP